jgi:hypothetical protein
MHRARRLPAWILGLAFTALASCTAADLPVDAASAPGLEPAPVEIPAVPVDVESLTAALDDASHPTRAEALERLRTATTFESAHIGEAGILSPNVAAFRVVLASPGAVAAFRDLAASASIAGRLYGLSGLYLTAPSEVDAAAARLLASGGKVPAMYGCIRMDDQVADIVRRPDSGQCDIVTGCYPEAFVGR